ncbi:hypothetical protein H920_08181 [Fukomys damarensis]|uniref:Uncharacterized protein n=1 Tax=Fukomys damarensis TaxID=885580 RepID=A0A091DE42_FUKDA|nr:hypothetical protein H920_08181 [Fukomys damarensis]
MFPDVMTVAVTEEPEVCLGLRSFVPTLANLSIQGAWESCQDHGQRPRSWRWDKTTEVWPCACPGLVAQIHTTDPHSNWEGLPPPVLDNRSLLPALEGTVDWTLSSVLGKG